MAGRLFLGRYEAIRLLGEGGMGRVYLARQTDQDRQVVVKVLQEKQAGDRHALEAFRREIDFMKRFRHPCTVEFYEASLEDPQGPCLVMEYVDGIPLNELLAGKGRLSVDQVGRLLGPLCDVLQSAHAQGITHRDLKPGNIMVVAADTPRQSIKVLDFGLAQLQVASSGGLYIPMEKFTSSRAQFAVGTPEYSCPEQLRGEEMDHRGDLYSAGVILFELLTGRLPFTGASINDIIHAHIYEPVPPVVLPDGRECVPPAVGALVWSCLAKNAADRPQSAHELARRFEDATGQKIWHGGEPLPPAKVASMAAPKQRAQTTDVDEVVFQLEAWMPQSIAIMKLRAFLSSASGEVVGSFSELLRMRLRRSRGDLTEPKSQGLLGWLGIGKKPEPAPAFDLVDMEVSMHNPDAKNPNRLLITIQLRPANGRRQETLQQWQAWCTQIQIELSAYLMAKKV